MASCSRICSIFCLFAMWTVVLDVRYAVSETDSGSSTNDAAIEYLDYRKTTSAKRSGVVTVEYEFNADTETDTDEALRKVNLATKEVVVEVLKTAAEDEAQSAEDGSPSAEAGAPSTGDDSPPAGNGAPSNGDGAPSTGDGSPAAEAPSAENGAPSNGDGDGTDAVQARRRRRRRQTARRRRRRAAGSEQHSVELVRVDPPVKDGRLRTSLVATNTNGDVLPAAELESHLHDNEQQLSAKAGYPVASVYVGLPPDAQPLAGVGARRTIWQKHMWMFIVVGILLAVAIITGLICLIYFRCCRKSSDDSKQPPPVVKAAASPVPVEEKMELGRAAPVQHSAPPPQTQQSPQPMKEETTSSPPPPGHSDDENGWIIPLDQLSQDELNQPDVQLSRL